MKNVLIACESSGAVRDAFTALGWNAWSCDLLPTERAGQHYQGDVLEVLQDTRGTWDLLIGHPPCTYLSSSGLHWNKRISGREAKTQEAGQFALALWQQPIPFIALENPVGRISAYLGKAAQFVQPYQFGHNASKRTGLWLKNLPALQIDPAQYVQPRMVLNERTGKELPRWDNQTDSGQNRLTPSPERWRERSKTYQGIADAMAVQWTAHIVQAQEAAA